MKFDAKVWETISCVIGMLFIFLGILYFILAHPVPAGIYLLVSIIYIPPVDAWIQRKLRFTIPIWIKIILAFLIIWYTLAVGEIMD